MGFPGVGGEWIIYSAELSHKHFVSSIVVHFFFFFFVVVSWGTLVWLINKNKARGIESSSQVAFSRVFFFFLMEIAMEV